MEWDTEAAEKHATMRSELRERMEVDMMQPYVPGAMWSKIMGGDAKWITNNGQTREITVRIGRCTTMDGKEREGGTRGYSFARAVESLAAHMVPADDP